jgi:hypothetical protein
MKVFISYDRIDVSIANQISNELKSLNIDLFQDVKNINWGEDFREKIKQVFEESITHLIVILSPASLKSQWVAYEIGYADANKIKILPFLLHPSIDTPSFMNGLVHITAIEELRKYFENLTAPQLISPIEISLKRHFEFSYPENKEAIIMQGLASKASIECTVNLLDQKVDYAGCAINLCNSDWTRYILNCCSLNFNVKLKNIKQLKIEIKGKNKETIGFRYISINDSKVSIDLCNVDDEPRRWKEMTEIVFLVEKENIIDAGNFTISNLEVSNTST